MRLPWHAMLLLAPRVAGLGVLVALVCVLAPKGAEALRSLQRPVWSLVEPGACVALGALGFMVLRGTALALAARLSGLSRAAPGVAGWLRCTRAFCEGACVEALSWPGKVWADVYRQWLLRPAPVASRLATVAWFRMGTGGGSVVMLALASATGEGALGLALCACAIIAMGLATARRRQSRWNTPGAMGLPVVGACGALCDVAGVALAAWWITGVDPLAFGAAFVLVSLLAAASTVPLGAGVLDGGLWWVLTSQFGVSSPEAIAVVVTYRACGPGLTLLVGSASWSARCLGAQSRPASGVQTTQIATALEESPGEGAMTPAPGRRSSWTGVSPQAAAHSRRAA